MKYFKSGQKLDDLISQYFDVISPVKETKTGKKPDRDFPIFLRWLREGKLKLHELITNRYKLEQINEAVDDLEHGRILGRGILTFN